MENHEKDIKHRVITMLDRREVEFLDKLGKDALFSCGRKLSYDQILRSLVDFGIDIDLSADNVDSLDALKRKIVDKVNQKINQAKKGG